MGLLIPRDLSRASYIQCFVGGERESEEKMYGPRELGGFSKLSYG